MVSELRYIREKDALKALLAPYYEQAEKRLGEREHMASAGSKAGTGVIEIPRFSEPVAFEIWPICMKNIVQTCTPDRGPHRAMANLAAFLYQAGWPEDEAYSLWDSVAGRVGVEPRIFDVWYGRMKCPGCATIQSKSDGYPRTGLGDLGYCPGRC